MGDKGIVLALLVVVFLMMIAGFFYKPKLKQQVTGFGLGEPALAPFEPDYPLLTDSDSCTDAGGVWERKTDTNQFYCVYNYTDGGTLCTDSDQCEGVCVIDQHIQAGDPITGQCLPSSILFGCFAEIGRYKKTGAISCLN